MIVRQGRLVEFSCDCWDDLPDLPELNTKGAIKDAVRPDEYDRRVLDYVRSNPDIVKSKSGFRELVSGKHDEVDSAAERLIARGAITRGPKGGFIIIPDRDSK